jgi:DNA-binding transcriptional regulator YhcF (GntR family)
MLSPHALSQERLLNPHVVESAYAKLVEAGLLCGRSGGEYWVSEHAPRLARDYLLQCVEEDIRDLVGTLRRAGLSAEEVQRILREVGDA